jgi:hypothetical protein
VTTTVLRADVTFNPADDLGTLMTVGEVVPARVVATAPKWALVLNDVDDDEPIAEAPSLLTGGPPWLVEEGEGFVEDEPGALFPPAPQVPVPVSRVPVPEVVAEDPAPEAPAPNLSPPRPNPAMLDRNRLGPAPRPPARPSVPAQAAESTKSLLLKIDGLTAEVGGLKREQETLRNQLLAGADERETLRYLLDQAERRANRAENDLKATRSRLRKAGNAKSATPAPEGPKFADAEQGFRYRVLTQWAYPNAAQRAARSSAARLLRWAAFPRLLSRLEGIKEEKVADVVFEVVTGLAPQIPGREVHHLRIGAGGDNPVRVREDGAMAWRASLQVKTPSARRLHYWILPNGDIELARVATHDDFDA